MKGTIKRYYDLAKPGIIYGNVLTAMAGFLFAAGTVFDGWRFLALVFGMSGVIGASCVLNNIIDRDIDRKMKRTKKRALAVGDISVVSACMYATILASIGFWLLASYTNWLAVALAAFAMFFYVVVYGAAKRRTIYGTLIGAIPGAIPPAAGYVAVTNNLDGGAWLLFLILVCWQMPHFYAIGIYRRKEYEAANIPIWSLKKGVQSTKRQMFLFIVLFVVASLLLTVFKFTGMIYALVMIVLGFWWLRSMQQGFKAKDDNQWAGKMFTLSLKVLLVFCLLLAVDVWLA